jgi:arylsulfatase A-like enzyme
MPPSTPAIAPTRSDSLLTLAVWIGLLIGFGEVVKAGLDRLNSDFIHQSRDALWMIPALDAGLFAVAGLVLLVIGRWVRVPWAVAAGLFAGLGAGLVLSLLGWLHPAAALVLAAGIGTQTARLMQARLPMATRLVRRSLPWLAGSVCLIAVLTIGWRTIGERLSARARPTAASGSPNILLLILDTVRAADLSLYGYARRTTPELERLAEQGTVFDRAFAASSWTLPSHASIFTGHAKPDLEVDTRHRFRQPWPTLAEVLHARGYATAGFVANTEYVSWESGLNRGFEHFEDFPVTRGTAWNATAFGGLVYPRLRQAVAPVLKRVPARWRPRLTDPHQHPSAERIVASFLAWLDRGQPAPFFVFLNFMEAHDFKAPDPFRSRFKRALSPRPAPWMAWSDAPRARLTPADLRPKQDAYDGAIAYLDSEIGNLFRELERRRLLNNTLVIVAADHGEEFAEHGLVSHGHSLYRLSLHVPLVFWFPGRVPLGRRVTTPVSLQNLGATVLDLVHHGRSAPLPGRSLARFWSRGDTAPDTIVAGESQERNQPAWYPVSRGDLLSVAFGGWRYIRNEGDGTEELYDFENDLLERWNLIGTMEGDRLLPSYRAAAALRRGRRAAESPRVGRPNRLIEYLACCGTRRCRQSTALQTIELPPAPIAAQP